MEETNQNENPIPNGLPFPFGAKMKSEGRALLELLCPEAFISGCDAQYTIILEDSLQVIKSVANGHLNPAREGGTKITGKQLVKMVKRSVDYYLTKTTCVVYAMLYDKINKVSLSKGDTQSDRNISSTQITDEQQNDTKASIDDKKKKIVMNYEPLDGISYKDRRPYLSLDTYIPRDWELALSDREGTARHIIGWICQQLLFSSDVECRVDIPVGKNFIIDGHCLDEPWVSKQCNVSTLENSTNISPDIRYVPIMKYVTEYSMSDGKYIPPREIVALVNDMYNEIGEADFIIPFYVKKLWNFFPNLEDVVFGVFSNDTDILYYCALQQENLDRIRISNNMEKGNGSAILTKYLGHGQRQYGRIPSINVIWKYYPSPNWVLTCPFPQVAYMKFVDIKKLIQCITNQQDETYIPPYDVTKKIVIDETKKSKKKVKEQPLKPKVSKKSQADDWNCYLKYVHKMNMPLQNIILSLMVAGSDYTKGYPGITHETFFKTMIIYYHHIKDLLLPAKESLLPFNEDRELTDSAAYMRLVKTAFMVCKSARFTKKKKLVPGTSVPIILPEKYDHAKISAAVVSFPSEKNRFPTPEFILCSYLHFSFYIKMVMQNGGNAIYEPCLISHCYYKKYESREWSRDNTQKVFTLSRAWTVKTIM